MRETIKMIAIMLGILMLVGLVVWLIWPEYLIPLVLAYLIGWLNVFAIWLI